MDNLEDKYIDVTNKKIGCNGGGGAMGHPMTYYIIGDNGQVACTYCNRIYRLIPESSR